MQGERALPDPEVDHLGRGWDRIDHFGMEHDLQVAVVPAFGQAVENRRQCHRIGQDAARFVRAGVGDARADEGETAGFGVGEPGYEDEVLIGDTGGGEPRDGPLFAVLVSLGDSRLFAAHGEVERQFVG